MTLSLNNRVLIFFYMGKKKNYFFFPNPLGYAVHSGLLILRVSEREIDVIYLTSTNLDMMFDLV